MAGRRGLVYKALDSDDRGQRFGSQWWQSSSGF